MVRDIELESKRFYVNERLKEGIMGDADLGHKITLDQESDAKVELLIVNWATNINGLQM